MTAPADAELAYFRPEMRIFIEMENWDGEANGLKIAN